ncbi:MAG TPA: globin [Acidimicrobiales bacterium]|jgi:hemoglobin|nr:globin [Acidimicrobiales bacterium]
MTDGPTFYDRVGGQPFFETLTRRFYEGVATDPLLRPLYPDGDDGLEESRRHLELFLIQYWGGPSDYNDQRGHPRLRMRHAPFVIGPAQRDAWVRHMTVAVKGAGLSPLDEMQLQSYLTSSAAHLTNSPI